MAPTFLDLPAEIRLNIYNRVFERRTAAYCATRAADDNYSLLPAATSVLHDNSGCSQLLRVCKTVLHEARPVLYDKTEFYITVQAFAGRLPSSVTNGHPAAAYVQRLTWQLDCDLLKHFYESDLCIDHTSLAELKSLEIRCRAEAWRDSFVGEWCDRESFVKGRQQMIDYANLLKRLMSSNNKDEVTVIEDCRQLSRGRVILRLTRTKSQGSQGKCMVYCMSLIDLRLMRL